MKPDIETLQDTFKIGYEAYYESRVEAEEVWNLFHNQHYTPDQLAKLKSRGQPKETFNIIKLFSRMLVGYYSTVNNTISVLPVQQNDTDLAYLLNDTINFELQKNNFSTEGDRVKLGGFISGLMCVYRDIKNTGRKDRFGRDIRTIEISEVPDDEIILDPLSRKDNYNDGRFIHRFKWLSEDQLRSRLKIPEDKIAKLQEYRNHMNVENSEFEDKYNIRFIGRYKYYDNYLVVHSNLIDDEGRLWSIVWCCDEILTKHEITNKDVGFHYRVQKIHHTKKAEYYGLFREVKESQHAINQALLKIQLSVNSQKIFVEKKAVEDINKFTDAVNRVHGVIPVLKLTGIKLENMTSEILDQYTIIDKGFDRIQKVLGINDSFLGLAFASDSGRKVKLQQNATILAQRYLTGAIEEFYNGLGEDMTKLIKQFFTAEQAIRVTDDITGFRWSTLNAPMMVPTGKLNPETGEPEMEIVYEIVKDPVTGEDQVDEFGNIIVAPIPASGTEIKFTEFDIRIVSVAFNDEDERNQLMLENVMSGNIGSALMNANPAGFFKIAGMAMGTLKTRYSNEMKTIMDETAAALGGMPIIPPSLGEMDTESKGSMELKLPQNTNEVSQDAKR